MARPWMALLEVEVQVLSTFDEVVVGHRLVTQPHTAAVTSPHRWGVPIINTSKLWTKKQFKSPQIK